ncbi:unnamed protein product [Amoebophrya sp. A25]|nr:unnamed protein product [Amoebophrya sp. A25]|eukprot:GSA25T00013341001.1
MINSTKNADDGDDNAKDHDERPEIHHAIPNTYLVCPLEFVVDRAEDSTQERTSTHPLHRVKASSWVLTGKSIEGSCASHTIREFDIRQFKKDAADFDAAFETAVYKRVHGPPGSQFARVFMGLSTGYDSGAIHLALGKLQRVEGFQFHQEGDGIYRQIPSNTETSPESDLVTDGKITTDSAGLARESMQLVGRIFPNSVRERLLGDDFLAYVVVDGRDREVLEQRIHYNNVKVIPVRKTWRGFRNEVKEVKSRTEPYQYSSENWAGKTLQLDYSAAQGISMLTRRGKDDGRRVYLSGSGADEIISDYGFNGTRIFPHSCFGGLFPDNLADVFPWQSFFLGTMRDYLMKDEIIAGFHGIEGRYPFLDFEVVQEFLWLTPEVKNSQYKSVLARYLQKHHYPVAHGKGGFGANQDLLLYPPGGVATALPVPKEYTLAGDTTLKRSTTSSTYSTEQRHDHGLVENNIALSSFEEIARLPVLDENLLPRASECQDNMYFVALRSRLTARVVDGEEFGCKNPNIKTDREGLRCILYHDLQGMLTAHFGPARFERECGIGLAAARLMKTVDGPSICSLFAEDHFNDLPWILPDYPVADMADFVDSAREDPASISSDELLVVTDPIVGVRLSPGRSFFYPLATAQGVVDHAKLWPWSKWCLSGFPLFRILQRLPELYAAQPQPPPQARALYEQFTRKLESHLALAEEHTRQSMQTWCVSSTTRQVDPLSAVDEQATSTTMLKVARKSAVSSESPCRANLAGSLLTFANDFSSHLVSELKNMHYSRTIKEGEPPFGAETSSDEDLRHSSAVLSMSLRRADARSGRTTGEDLRFDYQMIASAFMQNDQEERTEVALTGRGVSTQFLEYLLSRFSVLQPQSSGKRENKESHVLITPAAAVEESQPSTRQPVAFDPLFFLYWAAQRQDLWEASSLLMAVVDVVETLSESWLTEPSVRMLSHVCNRFLYINYSDGTWCDGDD